MLLMHDIHMHLIPGVDDGSWNLDMSMSMVQMAYEQGVRGIIATPHSSAFIEGQEEVEQNYQMLKALVQKYYPELHLSMGCEVLCRKNNMDKVADCLQKKIFPSLNGTAYVLTEFLSSVEIEEAVYCAEYLISHGYTPVIAHAERYRRLISYGVTRDSLPAVRLKDLGCRIQINAYSVFDETDDRIRQNAHILVENQLVDFLGTDAHRTFHRPPSVRQGLQYLYEQYEKNYIDAIAFENARLFLR